jgi:hypothetical protein
MCLVLPTSPGRSIDLYWSPAYFSKLPVPGYDSIAVWSFLLIWFVLEFGRRVQYITVAMWYVVYCRGLYWPIRWSVLVHPLVSPWSHSLATIHLLVCHIHSFGSCWSSVDKCNTLLSPCAVSPAPATCPDRSIGLCWYICLSAHAPNPRLPSRCCMTTSRVWFMLELSQHVRCTAAAMCCVTCSCGLSCSIHWSVLVHPLVSPWSHSLATIQLLVCHFHSFGSCWSSVDR